MCGFPAKDLEKYVEKLREKNDVTISRIGESSHEHTAYTLPSIDHEAEQAINAYEVDGQARPHAAYCKAEPQKVRAKQRQP